MSFWYYYSQEKANRMIKFDIATNEFSLGAMNDFPVEVPKGILLEIPVEYLTIEQVKLQTANNVTQKGMIDVPDTDSEAPSYLTFAQSDRTIDSKASLNMSNREWEVIKILDHRKSQIVYETKSGKHESIWEFLVKWRYLGGSYENMWLEEGDLCNAADMTNEYCKTKKIKFRLKPNLYQLNGVYVKEIKTTPTLYFSENHNSKNVKQRAMQDCYLQKPKNTL